jgi:hypothetical protein
LWADKPPSNLDLSCESHEPSRAAIQFKRMRDRIVRPRSASYSYLVVKSGAVFEIY